MYPQVGGVNFYFNINLKIPNIYFEESETNPIVLICPLRPSVSTVESNMGMLWPILHSPIHPYN